MLNTLQPVGGLNSRLCDWLNELNVQTNNNALEEEGKEVL